MMPWREWLHRHRSADPEAVAAVDDAQRKLNEADVQLWRARQIGAAGKRFGEVNHFAERWAAAFRTGRTRP